MGAEVVRMTCSPRPILLVKTGLLKNEILELLDLTDVIKLLGEKVL